MQFDGAHEPIVVGQRLFIGSSHDNSVTAYNSRTGAEIWTFFTDGPVRFAPIAWQDNIYFASDDGYLYCLRAEDGGLVWRFRGGPSSRKVLGNERLISAWPVRGAPVIADGAIYFAAGIWPFEGVFLHALDAKTGEVIWTNDGDGSMYIKQPHNADSFAGVAPQGPLVVVGDKLLIPGGRSVPACYDRTTGRMIHYLLAQNAKRGGGSTVAASERVFFNGGEAFDLASGVHLDEVSQHIAFDQEGLYGGEDGKIRAWDLKRASVKREETVDRKGQKVTVAKWKIEEVGNAGTPRVSALIKAGSRLYVGSEGRLLAFDVPLPEDDAEPAWEVEIEGTLVSLVAADDRLFATTKEGHLYCFGAAKEAPESARRHELKSAPLAAVSDWSGKAASVLEATGADEGYCVAWGVGSGGLVLELARQSQLRLIVIEPDTKVAHDFRERLRSAGIGGDRISVIVADPLRTPLPAYLASLAVAESLPSDAKVRASLVSTIFAGLRPYGGVACLPVSQPQAESLRDDLSSYSLVNASWKSQDGMAFLAREGALPGSADWTHEHADAANTRVSKDTLVKAPLGILWFGGPTNDAILPRHGHGPQPQVLEGRLFIEGVDLLRAIDIYTGRVLWEAPMPGLGELYNNTAHQPGANASGTNFIATREGIYAAYRNACWVLDPATGKRLTEFQLPPSAGSDQPPLWGYINVFDDYLIGGADPLYHDGLKQSRGDNDNYSSSGRLVVMDRKSGKILWTATARSGFRHNAICIGDGRLYAIDRVSGPHLSRLKRRGEEPKHKPRLVAFDLASGKELWSSEQDVFGTWLSYSQEHGVLVEAGRVASDTLSDEPKGMRAYAAAGKMLWENKSYSGPAMLHHDTILMAGRACELLTGKPHLREHPLSGELVEWTWSRNYGCNTPAASEHLLTFRSGAAGYFDFCNDGGTGNFGGFRSSCTNNLIVAGGLLNAPDYTRTCTCSYQNQTSLALAPMPDVEMWTSFGSQSTKAPVRRVGVNLGAPGDRKAEDGALWLEYPSIGGSSPEIDIKTTPEAPEWFRRHSSQIKGDGLAWVAASGARGLTSLKIELAPSDKSVRRYTVRLHFAEPDEVQPGQRLFQVKLQGETAIESLDVVAEAGGRNRSLLKEIPGVEVARELAIDLVAHPAAKERATVLCGVEVEAEGW
jgi:outer membrane protein assembly factor BamB